LGHAAQAEPTAFRRNLQSAAVIDHLHDHLGAGACIDRDLDRARLAVTHGVAEAFLDYAIDRAVEGLAEALAAAVGPDGDLHFAMARTPERGEVFQRLQQAELSQRPRAQPAKYRLNLPLDMGDAVADRLDVVSDIPLPLRLCQLLGAGRVDAH